MKRSKTASLVVMGLSPLFISACDDTQKSQQEFVSVEACVQAGVPDISCEDAHDRASSDAMRFATHYSSEALCDNDYDQSTCVETEDDNGNRYWFPAMSAFLIARVMHGSQVSYFPAGPVYRKRDHHDYSPRYGSVYAGGGSGGWHSVPADEVAGEGDTASRGGFGGGDEGGHS
ncbi:DUF1190 domain-containing protein [Dyella caseinilytica]|uniref:DUF1190 domain-containing protein n=1 Tax=Dyella caseinilytica TaxID=1849581 RepID=A0ABX7GXU8_9GAMM|nr:DUF1190 domain-containing protein [Dyella caseinilytica]QRN54783.1 DUF1190 domain-containing protein [Dyella caseinilytica]GFZ96808.1 hypothetical protein GCM10011408_16570 [Dyella caseinilytica]